MNPPDAAASPKALQDDIYRDKILSARKLTLEQRLADVFELSNHQSEYSRRQRVFVPILERETWLPTPEDVVVQKLQWGRNKDLDDARDVLAVQGPETLDMAHIQHWCGLHNTLDRLKTALDGIPPLD